MISVAEISDRLAARVEALVRELLPSARREGPYMKVGSVDGEAGASLVVYCQGSRQGKWQDFAGEGHGDLLNLIAAVNRYSAKADAVAYAKTFLGIVDDWSGRDAPRVSAAELARRAEEARARAEARVAEDAKERAAKIRGAQALFLHEGSVGLAGTAAERYLTGRGLAMGPVR
jgi:hypothetical protein